MSVFGHSDAYHSAGLKLAERAREPRLTRLLAHPRFDISIDGVLLNSHEPPFAAALWEVVWRFDVNVNDSLGLTLTPPKYSPNPFLVEAAGRAAWESQSWPEIVAEANPEPAYLLATAMRVERDPRWSNPERLLEADAPSIATDGKRRAPSTALGLSISVPPPSNTEHLQQMISRALLLASPPVSIPLLGSILAQCIRFVRQNDLDLAAEQDCVVESIVPAFNITLERITETWSSRDVTTLRRLLQDAKAEMRGASARRVMSWMQSRCVIAGLRRTAKPLASRLTAPRLSRRRTQS